MWILVSWLQTPAGLIGVALEGAEILNKSHTQCAYYCKFENFREGYAKFRENNTLAIW